MSVFTSHVGFVLLQFHIAYQPPNFGGNTGWQHKGFDVLREGLGGHIFFCDDHQVQGLVRRQAVPLLGEQPTWFCPLQRPHWEKVSTSFYQCQDQRSNACYKASSAALFVWQCRCCKSQKFHRRREQKWSTARSQWSMWKSALKSASNP